MCAVHVEARGQPQVRGLKLNPPSSLRQGLLATWSLSVRLGWLAKPGDPLVSAFLVLGLHDRPLYLSSSHGQWGSNSGAPTLPSKPPPYFQVRKSLPPEKTIGTRIQAAGKPTPSPHRLSSSTQWTEAPGKVTKKILCVRTLWDVGFCSVGHAQVVALFLKVDTPDQNVKPGLRDDSSVV